MAENENKRYIKVSPKTPEQLFKEIKAELDEIKAKLDVIADSVATNKSSKN